MSGPERVRPAAGRAARRRGPRHRGGISLAVYHTSADVEQHLAPLRRARRFTLACFSQRLSANRLTANGFDGVLWELSPGRAPDRRRLAAMCRSITVVSYSADTSPAVVDLSREMGFRGHLHAPLSPLEVERQLTQAPRDFAVWLSQHQTALAHRLRRHQLLLDIVRTTGETLDPHRIAGVVIGHASGWIPAPAWGLVAGDASGQLTTLADRGAAPVLGAALSPIVQWVLSEDREFATGDLAHDARVTGAPPATVLALPLRCRGRVVGALLAADRTASPIEPRLMPSVLKWVYVLLEVPAMALDNAIQLQRAEALSVTDDLTHLYNSRYLDQVLRRETKRASRSGRPLSLLFIDLDGFKGVNDSHGHQSGSRALVEAAAVIRGGGRETDVVARFGGDEFALVLPDTGSDGALAVAERIRERLAAHPFLAGDGLNIRLTASVGVATLPDVAASSEELLKAADIAMYRVKEAGKNGIHVSTG